MDRRHSKSRTLRFTASVFLALTAASALTVACDRNVESHGHVLRTITLEDVQPGVQTRDGVLQLLGTPSSTSPFDDKTWYYISETTENIAFLRPQIVERKVLVMTFDDQGILDNIGTLTEKDSQVVQLASRETPTAGHKLTILEQLLGNFGRFNSNEQ